MRPRSPAVIEDVGVLAPGILESVGEDREAVEGPIGVDAFGEGENGGREPGEIEGDAVERVADDVAEEH